MAKQKNFYDTYDALFKSQNGRFSCHKNRHSKSNFLTQIKSGKTTDEKKKNKRTKIIWIGIAVAIGFIVYIDLAEKDDYWDYSASSEDVYPLKKLDLPQLDLLI